MTAHNASCFNLTRQSEFQGPFTIWNYEERSVWFQRKAILIVSIFLAIFIVLIIGFAVFLRDRNAGISEDGEEALPRIDTIASELQRGNKQRGPSIRFARAPRRASRALRRRRVSKPVETGPTQGAHAAHEEAERAEAPSAANATSPEVRVTLPGPEPAPALAPRLDEALPELGPRVDVPLPGDADHAPYPVATRADRSDVEAVNAMHIEHEVAQPPAYIAEASTSPRRSVAADKRRAASPERAPTTDDDVAGTDELFAHIATDEKSVLAALHSAASAPPSAPSAPPSALGSVPSAPPSAPPMDAASEAELPLERGKGKQRYASGLPAPPIAVPPTARYDASLFHSQSSEKEAEAEAERAALASLLPSAPDEWAWQGDALPVYGAPSAPPGEGVGEEDGDRGVPSAPTAPVELTVSAAEASAPFAPSVPPAPIVPSAPSAPSLTTMSSAPLSFAALSAPTASALDTSAVDPLSHDAPMHASAAHMSMDPPMDASTDAPRSDARPLDAPLHERPSTPHAPSSSSGPPAPMLPNASPPQAPASPSASVPDPLGPIPPELLPPSPTSRARGDA